MTAVASRVTVTTTAVELGASVPWSFLLVRNRGAGVVYLGGPGVTSGAGFALDPGESVSVDLDPSEVLYGISAAGSNVCHVLQAGA